MGDYSTNEIIEKLATITARMDNYEKDTKILYRKTEELSNGANASNVSIQKMFLMMENMSNNIDEMKGTLSELSSKPAKNWDSIVKTLLTVGASGIATYVLVKLGLKI